MCSDGISFFSLLRANLKGIHAGGSVAGGVGAAWGPPPGARGCRARGERQHGAGSPGPQLLGARRGAVLVVRVRPRGCLAASALR